MVAFLRQHDDQEVIVLLNFSGTPCKDNRLKGLSKTDGITGFQDLVTGEAVAQDPRAFDLPPAGFKVLLVKRK